MKVVFLALLGVAAASIQVPENEDEAPMVDSLLTGEQSNALASSSLLETHTSVEASQNLRAKIVARMAGLRKQESMQAVTLSSSANMLSQERSKALIHSLVTDADYTMNKAVQMAIDQKASSKRVTLEELIVVEEKAKDTVDTVKSALSEAFTEMMASHKQCTSCKSDCHALQFKKYKVHTMAECQKNCKITICKESKKEEAAKFAAERHQEPHYMTSKFSSYIEDYSKAHGQQELLVNDEGKFEVVWEVPGDSDAAQEEQDHMGATEEFASDPVEQLRAIDKYTAQKSTKDILMQLHMEEEGKKKEKLVSAIQ